jgi:hypothetical protein
MWTAADAGRELGLSRRTLQDRATRAGWPRVGGHYVASPEDWRRLATPPPVTRGRPRKPAVSNYVDKQRG